MSFGKVFMVRDGRARDSLMSLMNGICCVKKKQIAKAIGYLLIPELWAIYFCPIRKLDTNIRKQETGPVVK